MKIREVKDSCIPGFVGAGAITIYPFIFYGPDDRMTVKEQLEMRHHEWVHVDQIRKTGFFRFYISYFLYYLASRVEGYNHYDAYMLIPYEQEARELEKEPRGEYV